MASLKLKEVFCILHSLLLFISGLILLTLSPYLLFKLFNHYAFIPSNSVGPFFVIFFLGIIHLFVTWLGIKGPTREHNFHIVLFMICTFILLVCEFSVGVWSVILWDEIPIASIDLMTKLFENFDNNKKQWSKLQNKLHCCGLDGSEHFNGTKFMHPTCFSTDSLNHTTAIFKEGCKKPLLKYTKSIMIDGVIIGFACSIFQALGIFIFYSFFKTLREARTERVARMAATQREMSTTSAGQIQPQIYVPVAAAPLNTAAPTSASMPSTSTVVDNDKAPASPPFKFLRSLLSSY
ncbi:tetraspanin-8-like [Rhynchophorus ferrugineus]|uniref:Tetraspanin n=1 Tax=Rhynchophorus ferrugineus TaxID=354439 RepID=A0A834MNT7_RHYFE|nr:hypothetical protein GWI33_000114 [Rhynchophorus ferrugineus]